MGKQPPPRAARPRAQAPPQPKDGRRLALNRNLGQQTRRLLAKHYRAKYGVK